MILNFSFKIQAAGLVKKTVRIFMQIPSTLNPSQIIENLLTPGHNRLNEIIQRIARSSIYRPTLDK